MNNTQNTEQVIQANLKQVSHQTAQQIVTSFQQQFDLLRTAAAIAALPNWKEVLEIEFDNFHTMATAIKEETVTEIKKNVPAEHLIQASSAASTGYEQGTTFATSQYNRLVGMVELIQKLDSTARIVTA